MSSLVKQFSSVQRSLIKIIDQFPKDQREKKLFGEWNLKDLLVHLTGWANYQTITLSQFKKGEELSMKVRTKQEINDSLVRQRRDVPWNQVYQDFLTASGRLIKEYEDLSETLWNTEIWKDRETTPKEFIQLEINHYKNTHGPQIKNVLDEINK